MYEELIKALRCWHGTRETQAADAIESLATQLAEAKADYEAAVEDLRDVLNGKLLHCVLCAHFKDDDVCGQKCESWEGWTYRGRQGNG